MYRGATFIMQNRVSIFQETIDTLLKNLSSEDLKYIYFGNSNTSNVSLLNIIALAINNSLKKYAVNGNSDRDNIISYRLITKIILGVFCLTPAFDTKVEASIAKINDELVKHFTNITISKINLLLYISDLCLKDHDLRSQLQNCSPSFDTKPEEKYPTIRVLDLILWK